MVRQTHSDHKLIIWIGSIAVAIACVVGLGLKLHWDNQYGSRHQRKAVYQQWHNSIDQRADEFREVFRSAAFSNMTAQQVASQVGGNVQVLPRQPWGQSHLQWVVDPSMGVGIRLVYDPQGQIVGSDCCGAPTSITNQMAGPPNQPKRKPIERRLQSFRQFLVPSATGMNLPIPIILWLGLVILAWVIRSARHLLLAAAMWVVALTGLFIMIAPGHHLLTETMSNDPLFWFTLMFLLTIGAIILERIERRVDPAACQNCGYLLTGNTTGICPECGEAIPDEQYAHLRSMKRA